MDNVRTYYLHKISVYNLHTLYPGTPSHENRNCPGKNLSLHPFYIYVYGTFMHVNVFCIGYNYSESFLGECNVSIHIVQITYSLINLL